jgi:hypothetical protein
LKTKILSILVLLSLLVIAIPCAVFADTPTTIFSVDWTGGGSVSGGATVGSGWNGPGTSWTVSSFATTGDAINGGYDVTTVGKQTYDVWGDLGPSSTNSIIASVVNGFAGFSNERTGATIYGIGQGYEGPGQVINSYVSASGGTASFDMSSGTNYADMANTSGGFNANAASFALTNFVGDRSTLNSAGFSSIGSGTADVDLWHSSVGYYGANSIDFGSGMGCYTDADVHNTGSGTFTVNAVGKNSITTASGWVIGGDGTSGSATYNVVANYGIGGPGSLVIPDYSLRVR